MAMVCVNGSKECGGCMACQEPRAESVCGYCAQCDEPVLSGEDHYELFTGELLHEDCMLPYVREKFFVRGGGQ